MRVEKGVQKVVRILVVEDEEPIRSSIVDMLELDDHVVLEASNGEEGLALARQDLPDLIISDIMMPVMDGHELFSHLKRDFNTAHIPFIFLTAMASYDDMREGMDLGADDYLTKPFDYPALTSAVNARLNKHAFEEQLRLRRFAQQLVDLQERERSSLAYGLEQNIQEELNGLKIMLNMANQTQDTSLVDKAQKITDELISRLQAFSLSLRPTMIDHLNIVSVLVWLIEQHRQRHKLNVQFDRSGYDIELSPTAKLGVYRIVDEVLLNVAQHAGTQNVFIKMTAKDWLHIEVRDDGTGFDLAAVLDSNTIGIKSMFERAKLMRGEINIQAIPGSGTLMTLDIPVEQTSEIQPLSTSVPASVGPKTSIRPRSLSSIRVLIADDHDIIRHGIIQLLSQDTKLEVVAEATSDTELLKFLRQQEVDIVILDMMLGDMSGFEIIKSVLQQTPQAQIVAFSSYKQEVYAVEALRSGARGYVLKDSSAIEIVQALHKVASGEQYICEALADKVLEWMLNARSGDTPLTDIYQTLTDREREILILAVEGMTSADIAGKLAISPRTVEKHRSNLMNKLGLKTPAQLMRFAIDQGLIRN